MKKLMLVCTLLVLIITSCGKDSTDDYAAQQAELDEKVIQSYLTTHALDGRRDDSGLYYVILKTGTGSLYNSSSSVSFNYTGQFTDNTTYYQGSVNTVVGNAEIRGWQIGLTKINKGGQIMLLIPSALAYGKEGKGTIPANRVLVHTIDIL